MMLEKLKGLALDRMSIDEGVEILTAADAAKATYGRLGLPVPEWLKDGAAKLEEDLHRRTRDALEAELKRLQARKAALRSREEEREEIARQEAAIQTKLGKGPASDGNA